MHCDRYVNALLICFEKTNDISVLPARSCSQPIAIHDTFNSSTATVVTLDLHGLLDSKQDHQALTHVHLLAPAIASPVRNCFDFAVHLLVEYNYV
jgi:hypothetical protein